MVLNYIIFILLQSTFIYSDSEHAYVTTSDGMVRGEYRLSINKNKYMAFDGIPYAKPPIGNLRFEEPEPVEPWSGVWISRKKPICLQFPYSATDLSPNNVIGHEDCLYLSVFTPTLDRNANLNVIVNIHGGAFMYGSSDMAQPHAIMNHPDIVYVNMHYRVGVLGFLSTEDDVVPGNNGMKDQVLALKWVQKNIQHFGGNARRVTIIGCSSGGASVHYLMLSPLTVGLFHNAISFSGSALNPWALGKGSLIKAKRLATYHDCIVESISEMVTCLKQKPGSEIVGSTANFMEYLYFPTAPFSVVVENGGKKPFLPASPEKLLVKGKVKDIPWMATMMEKEGICSGAVFLNEDKHFEYLNQNWRKLAPHLLEFSSTVPLADQNAVADKIKEKYIPSNFSADDIQSIIKMVGDRWFYHGIEKAILLQTKANKSPIYTYRSNYVGQSSFTQFIAPNFKGNLGASHFDDQLLMFPDAAYLNKEDTKMSNILLNIVISFAKTGKPLVPGIDWERSCCDLGNITYLNINSPADMKMKSTKSLSNYYDFWESLDKN